MNINQSTNALLAKDAAVNGQQTLCTRFFQIKDKKNRALVTHTLGLLTVVS